MSTATGTYDYRYEIRELDSAEEKIYIRTTGSDMNDGRTPGTAFLTVARAMQEIPIDAQYARVVDIGAGSFVVPRRIQGKSNAQIPTGQSNPFIIFQGATPVDSASQTITNVMSFSKASRVRLQIGAATWVPSEHIGKKIRFTSGAWNGSYALIKDNDANSIWITVGKVNGLSFPIVNGNTFVFVTNQTEFTSPITSNISCQIEFCSIEFINIDWNFLGGLIIKNSTAYFSRSKLNVGYFAGNNVAFISFVSVYLCPATTTPYIMLISQSSCVKFSRGSIIDGKSVADSCVFMRNAPSVRLEDELCLMRLDNGWRHVGIFIHQEQGAYAFFDWYNCVEGISSDWYIETDPTTGLPIESRGMSLCFWPEMYGNISGNFLIKEQAGSMHYVPSISAVSVSGGGVNRCSVDGTNEGYTDHLRGSKILGITKSKRLLTDGATTFSASGFDVAETASNTNPTALTNITEGVVGQIITIRGGSNINSTTIAHGGNFDLEGAVSWTASVGAIISLLCDASGGGLIWREVYRRAP